MMVGFSFTLNILYFACFRKATSTSIILTYPLPPFTTIRGLISNALGLPRDDYSLQNEIKIGIKITSFVSENIELAKILKLKEQPGHRIRDYPSAPMYREYLAHPDFIIFIGGEEEQIQKIHDSLLNPFRPLYIGQSDDLVDIEITDIIQIIKEKTKIIHSVTDTLLSDCTIEKIPYKFIYNNNKYGIEYKIISLFNENSRLLPVKKELFKFQDLLVDLI